MKYDLCYAYSLTELQEHVNTWLEDGWELYGSPFAITVSSEKGEYPERIYSEIQYVQAMTKKDD